MRLKTILTLTKKEFFSYFNSPIAYVFIAVLVTLSNWLFWADFFVLNQASMRIFFGLLPWLFLIVIPALTMRQWAEEKRSGTIEQLLTLPITQLEAVIGKYLASLAFLLFTLLITLSVPISVHQLGDLDLGGVLSSYIALLLLASSFIALGLFVSVLTSNQIAAFLGTAAGSFLLYILGTPIVINQVPSAIKNLFVLIGTATHYETGLRGSLDLRDVAYFLSITALFLFLNVHYLTHRDKDAERVKKANSTLQIVIFAAILIVTNYLTYLVPQRLDLTDGRVNSLTPQTKNLLGELDDVLTIKTYFSEKLPPRFLLVKQQSIDVLSDYQRFSQGSIKVTQVNPNQSEEMKRETQSLGIPLLQFSDRENDRFELSNGYLGVLLTYRDKKEVLPVIDNTSNLEFELSAAITKLTRDRQPNVAFSTGQGEFTLADNFSLVGESLGKQYNISTLDLANLTEIPEDIDTLIVAGPSTNFPDKSLFVLDQLITKGTSVLILADGVDVSQSLQAQAKNLGLERVLSKAGITLNSDLVLDASNEFATFNTGFTNIITPYPFWVKIIDKGYNAENVIVSRLDSVVFPWVSSLDLAEDKEGLVSLLNSSPMTFSQTDNYNLDPQISLQEKDATSPKTIAALYTGNYESVFSGVDIPEDFEGVEPTERTNDARIIVVGDADFATDSFVRRFGNDALFFLNAVDFLTQDERLIGIRAKTTLVKPLRANIEDSTKQVYKTVNIIGPLLLILSIAVARSQYRKRKKFIVQ